jgi:hypothetical protein
MSTKARDTRVQHLADDQKLIAGVQKYLSQFASLPVGSQTVTPTDIVKVLQGRIDAGNAAVVADAARTAAVKVDRDERDKTAIFVSSLCRMVVGMFSQSPDTLAAFGLHAPRAGKKTAQTKATAAAKSKATRSAHKGGSTSKETTVTGQPAIAAPPAAAPAIKPVA